MNPDKPTGEIDRGDPLFRRALEIVVAEQVEELRKRIPRKPRRVSGQIRAYRPGISRLRRIGAVLTVVFVLGAAVLSITPFSAHAYSVAAAGILSAMVVGTSLLAEVVYGSGSHVETQYIGPDGPFREYFFQPSVGGPVQLFGLLGLVTASVVLGYAEIYVNLSRGHAITFSKPLDGFSGLYFSLVTFATVGFGDLYPDDRWARLLVSSEIVVAMFVVVVVLATSMSWLLSYQQQLSAARAEEHTKETQLRERLIREAGMGLYAGRDFDDKVRAKMEELRAAEKTKSLELTAPKPPHPD